MRGSGSLPTSTPGGKSVSSELPKSGGTPKIDAPKGSDASKGTAKIGPKTSKLPTDRPSISDIRKRIEDGKSSKPGTFDAVGKSGAGKTGSDKIGSGKSGSGKSGSGDAGKTGKGPALVGPDKSKLPDVGKAKLSDIGKSKLPDVGKAKLPDGLPKAGDIGKPGGISPKGSTMKLIERGGPAAGGVKPGGVSSKINFPDRVKKGDLDRIATGAVAKNIHLSEQYKMSLQGDVARRAQLNKQLGGVHVTHATAGFFRPHPHYAYRGWVHPGYRSHSFHFG